MNVLRSIGESITDFFASFGRHLAGYALVTHVVALAPAVYGCVVLILLSVFPLIGIWAILPYKVIFLVKYAKMLVSVKLWPVFWAVISSFYNSGSLEGVLTGSDTASSALFIGVSMYLLVPVIAFGIVELSASFSGQAFHAVAQVANHAASAAAGTAMGLVLMSASRAAGSAARVLGTVISPVGHAASRSGFGRSRSQPSGSSPTNSPPAASIPPASPVRA